MLEELAVALVEEIGLRVEAAPTRHPVRRRV